MRKRTFDMQIQKLQSNTFGMATISKSASTLIGKQLKELVKDNNIRSISSIKTSLEKIKKSFPEDELSFVTADKPGDTIGTFVLSSYDSFDDAVLTITQIELKNLFDLPKSLKKVAKQYGVKDIHYKRDSIMLARQVKKLLD